MHHRVRTVNNTSTLTILGAEPKDRGTYICSAINELGKAQTTTTLFVDGTSYLFLRARIFAKGDIVIRCSLIGWH